MVPGLSEEIVKTLELPSSWEGKYPLWPNIWWCLQGAEYLGILMLFIEHIDTVIYLIPSDKLQIISKSANMTILYV